MSGALSARLFALLSLAAPDAAPPQLEATVAAGGVPAGGSAQVAVDGKAAPRLVRQAQDGIAIWLPERIYDGSLLVVELERPSCAELEVRWMNRKFPLYPARERLQALLPVPLGSLATRSLEVACGKKRVRFSVALSARDYPEARLHVDPKYTERPPRRTVEESANIRKALRRGRAGRVWSAAFVRPVRTVVTSPFGVRRTFNNKIASRHQGIDLDGEVGLPVMAANDGIVVLAATGYYYTGSAVFIDHGDELFSMYFHLSALNVSDGEKVRRGQMIGAVGRSGRVTGPHLHFGVKLAGVYIDPEDLMAYELPPETVNAIAPP